MAAITIAIVASIETLLSVQAVDRLDPLKRRSPPDRELLAQGAANTVSGFLGGLPVTAVIVRSGANVAAGGRERLSALVHGVLLLVAVLFAGAGAQHDPAGLPRGRAHPRGTEPLQAGAVHHAGASSASRRSCPLPSPSPRCSPSICSRA